MGTRRGRSRSLTIHSTFSARKPRGWEYPFDQMPVHVRMSRCGASHTGRRSPTPLKSGIVVSVGEFDVDDEYRRTQEQARQRAADADTYYATLKQAGLEGFERSAHRSSSTMNSPPVRGYTRWRISLPKLRYAELYEVVEVDDFLRELHSAVPWSDVSTTASVADIAGRPILIFADDWEADIDRALKAKVPRFAGPATERREAERLLHELVERRQATMSGARPVCYTRLYQTSWWDDREWLDWEVFVTRNQLFSETRTHPRMRQKMTTDIKAWKYRLELRESLDS